jgi:hypothetical protein
MRIRCPFRKPESTRFVGKIDKSYKIVVIKLTFRGLEEQKNVILRCRPKFRKFCGFGNTVV